MSLSRALWLCVSFARPPHSLSSHFVQTQIKSLKKKDNNNNNNSTDGQTKKYLSSTKKNPSRKDSKFPLHGL
ncbi:hypothetical protein BDV26DRAFT_270381, partial [Aspergillus bertholletiae]